MTEGKHGSAASATQDDSVKNYIKSSMEKPLETNFLEQIFIQTTPKKNHVKKRKQKFMPD